MKNNSQNHHYKNISNNISQNISKLEKLEDKIENDKSIIEFDDEYSEVPNLYSKIQKNSINDDQTLEKFEDDQNNYFEYSDPMMQTNSIKQRIINQNLKQLINIDINDKKGVIDLLMQEDLIQKKDEEIKEKHNNKYYYIEPKNKYEFSINKKNTYGRTGFHIEPQEGDPEFIKDMNVAANIIKGQMQQKDENLAKLLFDDLTPNNKKFLTRKEIGEKVEKALEKKRKNLEKIKAKIYEEQKKKEISPTNHRKKNGHQRNLNLFLKDQRDFQNKVLIKNQKLMIRSESEKDMLVSEIPFIDKKSKEIAKRINDNENVYLRLYDKSKDKEKIKQKINEKIKNEQKLKQIKFKNRSYSHIKSKINIMPNSPNQMNKNSKIKKIRTNINKNNY